MYKHAVALSLFTSTLALLSPDALAQHKKHDGAPKLDHVVRPAAALIVAEPGKPDASTPAPKPAKASYWLAADPHVPLAVVDNRQIQGVGKKGKDCGSASRWAKPKSQWRAVEADGSLAGLFEVKGAELFDVTQCREVAFGKVSGEAGSGLFVSADSGYKPEKSVMIKPSPAEKKKFERFLNAVEATWVDHKPLGKYVPWGQRTMFFEVSLPKDARWEGRVDGAGKPIERPKRWAVSGGPVLTIAYLGQHGTWHAATIKQPLGLADSYVPVAVFDMNGDGVPEIVYRSNDGASFADAVMTLDPATMRWDDAAESVGSSLL
jgi:hypothetical protein